MSGAWAASPRSAAVVQPATAGTTDALERAIAQELSRRGGVGATVAVIANGGLEDPARGEALIAAGRADLVALARGALANTDWPRRVDAKLPLAAYDPAMIRPTPTLENADAWRRQQSR